MVFNSAFAEYADKMLADIAIVAVRSKYADDQLEEALARIEGELENIKKQGTALEYLTVIDIFISVKAKPSEYCMTGVAPSLLISYALGLSAVDPMNCSPRLYPEFAYGIDGEKRLNFEFRVTTDLHRRIFEHIDSCSDIDVSITRKYDEKNNLIGINICNCCNGSVTLASFYINYFATDSAVGNIESLDKHIVDRCKPNTPEEYVKCYGFEHGTGVWESNAEVLLDEGIPIPELIANREDVYEYLLERGIDKTMAYAIAEYVRLGKAKRLGWGEDMLKTMNDVSVPDWFKDSCRKIGHLSTRAHAYNYYYNKRNRFFMRLR